MSTTHFEYQLTGTLDRGDGQSDISADPPACPEHCGGDAYKYSAGVWHCSDCDGTWDDNGDELE